MNDLSLFLLDILFNCIEAKCKTIKLLINENVNDNILEIIIEDDGVGMTEDMITKVTDPFFTSRKSRKVGLGIPLYKEICDRCGGSFRIESSVNKGTKIYSSFMYNSIDLPDLGDINETICTIVLNEGVDIFYQHQYNNAIFTFDTKEIKKILGDVSITDTSVVKWINDYIKTELKNIKVKEDI